VPPSSPVRRGRWKTLVRRTFAAGALGLLVTGPLAAQPAPDRRVVLTFDDLPATAVCDAGTIRAITDGIVTTLASAGVTAAAFATLGRGCLEPDLVRETLSRWTEVAAPIGNHTATHPDLNSMSLAGYLADLDSGQALLEAALAEAASTASVPREKVSPGEMSPEPVVSDATVSHGDRWFRPPLLHTGPTPQKQQGLAAHLGSEGYRMAPVSADNQEWVYAAVYEDARRRGDDGLAVRVVSAYLEHLNAAMAHAEETSRRVTGREIPQILLLHANRLNADHLSRALTMLERRGYRFVPLGEALEDPAWGRADPYVGRQGLSWLTRWALEDGIDVQPEPREHAWVAEAFREVQRRGGG